ncbi:AMP deaminase 1-like [Ciona intestinalis]
MGSSCSKNGVGPSDFDQSSSKTSLESGKCSPGTIAYNVERLITSQVENGFVDNDVPSSEQRSKRLSDIAEMLFLQQQTLGTQPAVEMGNEKPIELESEQTRRRLQKHRASVAYANGRGGKRASIVPDFEMTKTHDHELPPASVVASSTICDDTQVTSAVLTATESDLLDQTKSKHSILDKQERIRVSEMSNAATPLPDTHYQRVSVTGELDDLLLDEIRDIGMSLIHALKTRQHYMRACRQNFPSSVSKALSEATGKPCKHPIYPDSVDPMGKPHFPYDEKHWKVETKKGIVQIIDGENEVFLPHVNRDRFVDNRNLLYAFVADGPLKTFCYRRLSYLKNKFGMHRLLNEEVELEAMKNPDVSCRRDFYNVRKVDTHIHAAACMGQKHLLGFIQEKGRTESDRVVLVKDGVKMTLKQVFDSLQLDPHYLNVDSLDVHADRQTFHRFDRFNNLYSPMGASELREIFLKTSNDIGGEYFADIIRQVENSLVEQKYHYLELRLSIYGKNFNEWQSLARWFTSHKLQSTHIRWMIQVPRLYDLYKAKGVVDSFEEILDNVFRPVFEATVRPHKNKELSLFLRHITGFDSVDDESKQEPGFMKKTSPTPDEWKRTSNPSYTYYLFYMYSNIARLNYLRHTRGMNTFTLRPHSGEAGHHDHLLTAFMLAENISHGLVLKKVPVLQYLYYLAQVGICMSPLSNNHLFLEYNKSPFPDYFARGLNVCLSTDDPLQFHFTMEPLMEEYAVAAQVWKLSVCDMCELSRNSVQVSSFSHTEKQHWLGSTYS